MYARKANLTDLPDIFKIIDAYDFIYGVDINSLGIKDNYKKIFQKSLESDIGKNVIVSTNDNQITGVGLQTFMDTAWILSFYFFKQRATAVWSLEGSKSTSLKCGGIILDKMIELAEEKQYKEFYWVFRETKYSKINKRIDVGLSIMSPYFKKYVIETIEVILPHCKTKFPKVEKYLLGNLNGLNKKTIAVRHGYIKI